MDYPIEKQYKLTGKSNVRAGAGGDTNLVGYFFCYYTLKINKSKNYIAGLQSIAQYGKLND